MRRHPTLRAKKPPWQSMQKTSFKITFIERASRRRREGRGGQRRRSPGPVPRAYFLRGILLGQSWKKSLHIMAMQARKVTYSWKSTSLSLLQSRWLMSCCKLASLL